MGFIQQNVYRIFSQIPPHVRLIAVSKTKSVEEIREAYEAGVQDFGENYVQELKEKYPLLPEDIRWHFIGHLQRNKVKYIAPFVAYIHSVDDVDLLKEIEKQAAKNNRKIPCLLQISIATDGSKFGFALDETFDFLKNGAYIQFEHIIFAGVMGMGSLTEDREITRKEYRSLKHVFDRLKNDIFADCEDFREISMGMSHDYDIAIEEGATMVRIGTAIFGERVYQK